MSAIVLSIPEPEKPDYGDAVVNGVIRYVSASSIASFNREEFGGCPRRYWFEKIDGRKTLQTKATAIGGEEHKHLAHYLKTGEDVLTNITRPGKHFLPKPGSDLVIEHSFGEYKKALETRERVIAGKGSSEEVAKYIIAPHGIPVMGAMDVRHRRGEWVDNDGDVRQEVAPNVTAEVLDHKTSSDIKAYAKRDHELPKTTQMALYAKAATHVWPDLEFVRVSHGYFGTRTREAQKYTALMSIDTIERRFEEISSIVLAMTHVAQEKAVDKVEPNLDACNAYRGCPHSSYCDRPKGTAADLLQLPKGAPMSTGLFGTLTPPTTTNGVTTAPPPPTDDAERQARIEAARALLAAEDVAAPVVSYGFCSKCGSALSSANASKTKDGSTHHMGCTALAPPPPVVTMPHIGMVNPPDALPATLAQIAVPLSPETIAKITDPEIAARAKAHAEVTAVAPVATAGTKEKTHGRCLVIGQKILVTADEILAGRKKWTCPKCGKEMKLKPEKNEDGGFAVTITSHNIAGIIVPTPPVAPVFIPPAPPASPAALPPPVPLASAPPAPPAPPVPTTVPSSPPSDLQRAVDLWTDGKYEAASSLSLILIASSLSNR